MKTIRLAGLTALISSVVLLDGRDAWAGSPESPQDEEMAARLRSIADDPELAADTTEYEKIQADMLKKKTAGQETSTALTPAPEKKKGVRRTLGNTKIIRKKIHE